MLPTYIYIYIGIIRVCIEGTHIISVYVYMCTIELVNIWLLVNRTRVIILCKIHYWIVKSYFSLRYFDINVNVCIIIIYIYIYTRIYIEWYCCAVYSNIGNCGLICMVKISLDKSECDSYINISSTYIYYSIY